MPRFRDEWSFIASMLQGSTPEEIDKALEGMSEFQRSGVKRVFFSDLTREPLQYLIRSLF
jgi:hypothetical protein